MLVFLTYLGVLAWIGIRDARRVGGYADFVAAGGRQGGWMVWATLMATMVGASATAGVAARAGTIGWAAFWWLGIGAAGLLAQGVFLARKIHGFGARTLPEMAGMVVGPWGRRGVGVLIAATWVGVVAAQLIAVGQFLGEAAKAGVFGGWGAGVPPTVWAAMAGGVVALYTIGGGQLSVVRTDAVQWPVLCAGLAGAAIWVWLAGKGGETAGTAPGLLNAQFGTRDLLVMALPVWGAFFLGPDIVSRNFVARDGKTAARAAFFGAVALVGVSVMVTWLGIASASVLGEGGADNPLFGLVFAPTRGWPRLVGLLLGLGLLSALLSSADTCLMNAAAILCQDVLGIRRIAAIRLAVIVLGAAAIGLVQGGKGIIEMLLAAYSVYTPGVVMPLAVAIWAHGRRRIRLGIWGAAVLVGCICGLVAALGWVPSWLSAVGLLLSFALSLLSAN